MYIHEEKLKDKKGSEINNEMCNSSIGIPVSPMTRKPAGLDSYVKCIQCELLQQLNVKGTGATGARVKLTGLAASWA